MVRKQQGFTIIELVVVIVILGILAAVAFPKFQDLSTSAVNASLQGGAAALKSSAVIMYAKNNGSPTTWAAITGNVSGTDFTYTGSCSATTVSQSGQTTTLTSVSISDFCSG